MLEPGSHPAHIPRQERILRSTSRRSPYLITLQDFVDGWSIRNVWLRASYLDVKRRYVRTVLGPFWATGHIAVYIVSVGYIFSSVLSQDRATYIPYLTTGFIAWMLVYNMFQESAGAFVSASSMRQQLPFPYSMYIFSMMWRNLIAHLHNFVLYLIIVPIYGVPIRWTLILLIPGYFLVFLNFLWIGTLIATLAARYRDVTQLVASLIQVMVFVTPIFYSVEALSHMQRTFVLAPNLLYHLTVVLRAPLLGQVPPLSSYGVLVIAGVVGCAVTGWFFGKKRSQIIFWIL
jgi:ABC-2 type transport system permease protein